MIGHIITNGGAGIGLLSGPLTEFTFGLGFVLAVMAAIAGLTITYGTMWFMAEGKVPALTFLALVGGTAVIGVANVAPAVFTYSPDERTNAIQAAALGLMFGIGAALARWRPQTGPAAAQSAPVAPQEDESVVEGSSQTEQAPTNTANVGEESDPADGGDETEEAAPGHAEQATAGSSAPDIVNRDIKPQEDD